MKTIFALALAGSLGACAAHKARVHEPTETTAAAPACKEIPTDGKPARCEAVSPTVMQAEEPVPASPPAAIKDGR